MEVRWTLWAGTSIFLEMVFLVADLLCTSHDFPARRFSYTGLVYTLSSGSVNSVANAREHQWNLPLISFHFAFPAGMKAIWWAWHIYKSDVYALCNNLSSSESWCVYRRVWLIFCLLHWIHILFGVNMLLSYISVCLVCVIGRIVKLNFWNISSGPR